MCAFGVKEACRGLCQSEVGYMLSHLRDEFVGILKQYAHVASVGICGHCDISDLCDIGRIRLVVFILRRTGDQERSGEVVAGYFVRLFGVEYVGERRSYCGDLVELAHLIVEESAFAGVACVHVDISGFGELGCP